MRKRGARRARSWAWTCSAQRLQPLGDRFGRPARSSRISVADHHAYVSYSHSCPHRRFTEELLCDENSQAGGRITKNVPILRLDHTAIPTLLFGMREVAQRS